MRKAAADSPIPKPTFHLPLQAMGPTVSYEFTGLLCIGDPHLASRVPGFRKDDYPRAILDKLTWAMNYARENRLLPTLLGDLFHWPRDNATRLLVQLLE